MDQTSERFKSFQANNNHIDFEIFKGINGKNLDFKKLINDSLITEELATSPLFTKEPQAAPNLIGLCGSKALAKISASSS